jgi:hypothetical protein
MRDVKLAETVRSAALGLPGDEVPQEQGSGGDLALDN